MAKTLENIARVALAGRDPGAVVRLAAAATALQESIGAATALRENQPLRDDLATARQALSEQVYVSAWESGLATSVDQAVEFALAWAARPTRKPARPEKLSQREVAVLITRGLTNRQIATELFISERTADTHVQNILNKLGFSSRAQVAAWAAREELEPTKH
jgi:non-specific serine/threonine protein kinase